MSSQLKLSPIAHWHHSIGDLSLSPPDNLRRGLSLPDRLTPPPNLEKPSPTTVEPTQAKCWLCDTVKELAICQDCCDAIYKRIECGYHVQKGEEDIETPCGGDAGYCSEHVTLIKKKAYQKGHKKGWNSFSDCVKGVLTLNFRSQVTALIELL